MENSNRQTDLEEAIAKTIAFFDLFDYPLTAFEVWKFLFGLEADFSEVRLALEKIIGFQKDFFGPDNPPAPLCLPDRQVLSWGWIEKGNGFCFLSGRRAIVKTRFERYNLSEPKFRRAAAMAKIFKIIPWVKVVAVANLIGSRNLKKESDVDFLIVVSKDRLWTTRFIAIAIAKLLGLRPAPGKSENKVCLSFFVDETELNLSKFRLPESERDIYFCYWFAGLFPIFAREGGWEKFIAKNTWIIRYLPNFHPASISGNNDGEGTLTRFFGTVISMIFHSAERFLEKIQIDSIRKKTGGQIGADSEVVVGRGVAKTHFIDRRKAYREKFERRLNEVRKSKVKIEIQKSKTGFFHL